MFNFNHFHLSAAAFAQLTQFTQQDCLYCTIVPHPITFNLLYDDLSV